MAPAYIIFVSLLPLPGKVLWEHQAMQHVTVSEAVSDEHEYREIANTYLVNNLLVVASERPSATTLCRSGERALRDYICVAARSCSCDRR